MRWSRPMLPFRTVPRIEGTPGHRWERRPCKSGTPRRGLAKRPWTSRFLCSEPIVVSSPLSELIETDPNWLGGRDAERCGPLGPRSEGGFRLREPRDVDLPDEVPPFCGHRRAGFVAAVPVLDLVHLYVAARDRDHEGLAPVPRGPCGDSGPEDTP